MKTIETLLLIEKIYARRREVSEAKLRLLEGVVRRAEEDIRDKRAQASGMSERHMAHVLRAIGSATKARHYPGLASHIAARQTSYAEQLLLLRFETLRAEESLQSTLEAQRTQRAEAERAGRKTEKFEPLIDEERAAEERLTDAIEEEAALETQSFGRQGHA